MDFLNLRLEHQTTDRMRIILQLKINKTSEELDIMETVISSVEEVNRQRDNHGLGSVQSANEAEVGRILKNQQQLKRHLRWMLCPHL